MNDAEILGRLDELGLELPPPPEPVASYLPVTQSAALAFVAGQVAMIDGQLLHPGKLGQQVSIEMGQQAAARAALQAWPWWKFSISIRDPYVSSTSRSPGFVRT